MGYEIVCRESTRHKQGGWGQGGNLQLISHTSGPFNLLVHFLKSLEQMASAFVLPSGFVTLVKSLRVPSNSFGLLLSSYDK